MEAAAVERALAATGLVATELALPVDEGIVLQNANRLAVRLLPCDVLARVAPLARRNHEAAVFELDMGKVLGREGGVVGELDPRVEPIVHVRDGFAVTFWTYYEPLPAESLTPDRYADALERLHEDMRQVTLPAYHFTERVDEAYATVVDPARSPDLADADRELLVNVLRGLRRAVVERCSAEQLLHGEPHPGNILDTADGVRFIDLQTCCYGPVEFDVAHTPSEVGRHYRRLDPPQLRDCRTLMMAMIAAWRYDRDDEFPNRHESRKSLIRAIRTEVDRTEVGLDP